MIVMAEMDGIHVRRPEGNVSTAGRKNGGTDRHEDDKKKYVLAHCRLPVAAGTILLIGHIKGSFAVMAFAAEITLRQF